MITLLNSPENDVLFNAHYGRINQINRNEWMYARSTGRHNADRSRSMRRAMVRFAGVLLVASGLALSAGSSLAAAPQIGITSCDQHGCTYVSRASLTDATRTRQASASPNRSFPAARFDPRFNR